MPEQLHRRLLEIATRARVREGKITVLTSMIGCLALMSFFVLFDARVPVASADNVSTSVTVLNTPPTWTVMAEESTESSTSTPTNAGAVLSWVGTATDSSNDDYYLLICKTSGTPTANANAAPSCNGGISNQWAVSTSTLSGLQATAATTTKATFPFDQEKNDWWAWVCDGNSSLPRCYSTPSTGSGTTASPFVINHPPIFVSVANTSPTTAGSTITWTATAYDNDSLGGSNDTIRLIVCRSNDFSGTTGYCGAGGTFATSTAATTNPSTSTPMVVPTQDRLYNAYTYIIDQHGLVATSTAHGSNSFFYVNNSAPTITAATVSLVDYDNVGNLTLTVPQATSGPFKVQFTAIDNNSCLNASSTAEISSAVTNVYRSGIASTSCLVSGDYNSNNCYAAASPLMYDLVCTQDGGTCSGASDTDATFTCTFSMWYNADPTDAGTPWTAQNWLASARVTDNNASTSPWAESTSGNELTSFLAFDVPDTSIAFGQLEPGQSNDPLATSTKLYALGNTGLDQLLYGDTMCTNWTAPDSCDAGGINAASEIPVSNQRFATSSVAFASPLAYTLTASTATSTLQINVQKTTATATPQNKSTWWGIQIPITITQAGNYFGQNTLLAQISNFLYW